MGPQHALLCVKQAKAYLDEVLAGCQSWDEALRNRRASDLADLFGGPDGFATCKREGVGIGAIQRFLGGAFAKGHGVRDALAILTSGQEKARVATETTDAG